MLGVQPALDQIRQQRFARRRVFGSTLTQPEHVLFTLLVDAYRRQHWT